MSTTDDEAANRPGFYNNVLLRAAGAVVSTAITDAGVTWGGADRLVAVDVSHIVGNDAPGWIAMHGRVRVDGLQFDRDESGTLIVSSIAPPVEAS